jgi:hypothetical protein
MDERRGDRLLRWAPIALLMVSLLWITSKAVAPISDPDDWWHLRLGNELLNQRSFATPSWSSYADQNWVPTEPVPEVVSAMVDRIFGYAGLAWLFGVALFLVTVSFYALNRQLAAPLPAVVATVASFVPMYGALTSRPQLVSFMLLPIALAVWIRTEQDLRPRWWLLPLIWLWSLCHGFWFIGAAYGCAAVAAIAVGRRATRGQLVRLVALAVGCVAGVLLNPVGVGVFEAPLQVNSSAKFITEWQHPSPMSPGPFGAWLLIVLAVVLLVVARHLVTPFKVALLVAAAFWTWYAERTVIIAAISFAPVLASGLDALLTSSVRPLAPRGAVGRFEWRAIGATFAVAAAALALAVSGVAREPGDVPRAFDSTLDRVPPSTGVFTAYVLGGWIAWRHAELNQYIDGLSTPYSRDHYLDFFAIENQAPGWYRLVDAARLSVAIVDSGSPVARGLESRGWQLRGSDAGYVLLMRPGVIS